MEIAPVIYDTLLSVHDLKGGWEADLVVQILDCVWRKAPLKTIAASIRKNRRGEREAKRPRRPGIYPCPGRGAKRHYWSVGTAPRGTPSDSCHHLPIWRQGDNLAFTRLVHRGGPGPALKAACPRRSKQTSSFYAIDYGANPPLSFCVTLHFFLNFDIHTLCVTKHYTDCSVVCFFPVIGLFVSFLLLYTVLLLKGGEKNNKHLSNNALFTQYSFPA